MTATFGKKQGTDPVWPDLRLGTLKAILAGSPEQILAAQKLRYQVFYQELGAKPSPDILANQRDFDAIDPFCNHLLVMDEADDNKVVATYRLLRKERARQLGYFYTASEYDISSLEKFEGNTLELGRSCVDPGYRDSQTVKLLWRGLGAYITLFDIDLLFGCGSLNGACIDAHAEALSYLYHHHLAPAEICPRTLAPFYVSMDILPRQSINARKALAKLPALIKAYLRVGGFVGDGAFIDTQFNTTDVCIVVKTDLIKGKYLRQYF